MIVPYNLSKFSFTKFVKRNKSISGWHVEIEFIGKNIKNTSAEHFPVHTEMYVQTCLNKQMENYLVEKLRNLLNI